MTVPNLQHANVLVEFQNQTLAIMLAINVDESHKDWDEFFGFDMFFYKFTRQESTSLTPFKLVYGREAVIPADLLVATGTNKLIDAEDLMEAMMDLSEDVKDRFEMVQQRQKTQYDARVSATPVYNPSDLVLVLARRKVTTLVCGHIKSERAGN